jgi:hypothetical protein
MFRVLRLQNENKIVEFLTEKFFGSKSNLTNRALVSLKSIKKNFNRNFNRKLILQILRIWWKKKGENIYTPVYFHKFKFFHRC